MLTRALMAGAVAAGAELVSGTAVGLAVQDGAVTGVQLSDGRTLPADTVVRFLDILLLK